MRNSLRGLLEDWSPSKECNSMICPKIQGGGMIHAMLDNRAVVVTPSPLDQYTITTRD
jgi:hypothetical protein